MQQDMRCPVEEARIVGTQMLQPFQRFPERGINHPRRVPAKIRGEAPVEEVKAGALGDIPMRREQRVELVGREKMRRELDMTSIDEVDLQPVPFVVLAKVPASSMPAMKIEGRLPIVLTVTNNARPAPTKAEATAECSSTGRWFITP